MNEILFYVGIVLSSAFFILTIILFFTQNIIGVIKYYLKMRNKKIIKSSNSNNKNLSKEEVKKAIPKSNEVLYENEETELLDVVQNYATALLDADSTTLLPELNEEEK